ncbi:MAG: 2Fe-2S iron-sulfur cluster-binding protein [Pyrinomonadaceae bacterium]
MAATRFESNLRTKTEEEWLEALNSALSSIHEVDRNATQIWFGFYPLALHRYLEASEDPVKTAQRFVMQGNFKLSENIDGSHTFLYGSRYWQTVKTAIAERAESYVEDSLDIASEARSLADTVSSAAKCDSSLALGIAFVGLMTLNQTGLDLFKSTDGAAQKPSGILAGSPESVLAHRKREKKQGFLGFLKTINKDFIVNWDEAQKNAEFPLIEKEEIASASARDQSRDWKSGDARCLEGVIPVECRAAACGTCWVGVISGAENLSDVQRLERKQMEIFGYRQGAEAKPIMRLACQAKADGNVSIVIPPWNGVFGRKVYGVEEVVLEPATKSAARLRETIASAIEAGKEEGSAD